MRGNRVYVKKNTDGGAASADPEETDAAEKGNDSDEHSKNREVAGEQAQTKSGSGKSGGNVPDGFEAVQVTTGIINDDYVEILSGLSEGDEVYVSSDSGSTAQTNQWQMGGQNGMGGPGGNMGGAPGDKSGNNGSGRRNQ